MDSFQAGQNIPEELKPFVCSYIIESLPRALKTNHFIARPGGIAFDQPQFGLIKRLLFYSECFAYARAKAVVFGSETEAHTFIKKFGFTPKNSFVIPTGVPVVNSSVFTMKKKVRLLFGFKPTDKVALFVGRLKEVKGYKLFLQIAREMPDWKFLMLVKGEVNFEVPPNVFVFSNRVDPADFYLASDVFVLPSYSEGTPRALLEAMAFGLPCVVRDIDLFIENWETGLVVVDNDWCKRIETAYKFRKELGAKAKKYVLTNHSLSNNKFGWEFITAWYKLYLEYG